MWVAELIEIIMVRSGMRFLLVDTIKGNFADFDWQGN